MITSNDLCFFVSDLHGRVDRYHKLLSAIRRQRPSILFIGGDLLPSGMAALAANVPHTPFIQQFLAKELLRLREELTAEYPRIFVILGNDDGRFEEEDVAAVQDAGLWEYVHNRVVPLSEQLVIGYNYVPPTPFLLKDWERYDVSRYVDPGCVSPEEGRHSPPFDADEARYSSIARDLKKLTGTQTMDRAILLFHTPPYQTNLDWIDHSGRLVDGVEPDRHIGSIAVRRLIEARMPLLTLHGHAHESARLSGNWRDQIGPTILLGAAHDGNELALVTFKLSDPGSARRELL